jgi:hypothetical protein
VGFETTNLPTGRSGISTDLGINITPLGQMRSIIRMILGPEMDAVVEHLHVQQAARCTETVEGWRATFPPVCSHHSLTHALTHSLITCLLS